MPVQEAGRRAARQSVSVSQPVWGRLRGGGGLPHAPEHVRACRSDGLQGEGERLYPPCPCHPLLRTCAPTFHPWPLAPAHHRAPSPGLALPLPVTLGKPFHFSVGIDFTICAMSRDVPMVLSVLRFWECVPPTEGA